MKLKNVSFFEQHFEKVFVGIGAAVLLAVAWLYLFGSPNVVEVGGQKMEPAKIDEYIASKAKSVRQQAESDEEPEWAKQRMVRYRDQFESRTREPVLKVAQFGVPAVRLANLGFDSIVPPERKPFIEPTYPAPTMYAWAARIGSLATEEVEGNKPMEELFAADLRKAKAFDTPYISLVGKWDTATVLEQLTQKDEDENLRSIPEDRIGRFVVMDVRVERQTLQADGAWSKPLRLPVNPPIILQDQQSPTGVSIFNPHEIPDVMDPAELGEEAPEIAVGLASLVTQGNNQWLIIQPPFPQMVAEEWEVPISPEEIQQRQENLTEKEQIEDQFKEWQKQIDRYQAQIQKLQNRAAVAPAAPAPAAMNVRRAPAAAPANPAPRPAAGNQRVAQLQAQIERIINNEKVAEKQKRYQEITNGQSISLQGGGALGRGGFVDGGMFGDPGGFPAVPGAAGGARRPNPTVRNAPQPFPGGDFFGGDARMMAGMQRVRAAGIQSGVLTDQELDIYSHDLTVEPGKTYRYRFQLRVVNPLYNLDMPEEQKAKHQNQFLVETDWTEWTAAIEVPRLRHYFISSLSPTPAPGRANVEVWRYYKGLWWTVEFTGLRPGTPIGQVQEIKTFDPDRRRDVREQIDFFTGAYLLDIIDGKSTRPRGPKESPKARFLVDEELIAERTLVGDKDSELRERLRQDKQQLERLAGIGGGPVARVP